jgi:hypothetical protein
MGLTAYTQDGCTATDSITIKTIAKPVVELPVIYPTIIRKSKEKLVFKNLPDGASITIFNNLGQIVRSGPLPLGEGWGGACGVYYYVVSFTPLGGQGGFEVVRKLVVLE